VTHFQVRVEADPAYLYALVTDITRIPEWTDRVRRATWLVPDLVVRRGTRFRLRAGVGWRRTRTFEVVVADPGRAFAFRSVTRRGTPTVWSFAFKAEPEGTTLTAWLETGAGLSEATSALDRIVATAEGRRMVPQAQLGQAHTAEGPLDLSAMFVMHHGFRRDLRDLVRAVPATPVTDATAWGALERRWAGMATALLHHHRVEDQALWPPLRERVVALGDAEAEVALKAMESEHEELDPAIGACAAGFRAMVVAPGPGTRARLSADLVAMQSLLVGHLEHEETNALPLAQRHLSLAAWDDFEEAARKEYGLKDIGFAVPWSTLEIPEDQFAIAYAHGGTLVRAVLAVTQRRFEREHQVAFRHLPVG
jgi:hypothetical protein